MFGGGSATPPEDAAATLARGAKRLRAVIETETRAGQTLAASWAGESVSQGMQAYHSPATQYRSPGCICIRGGCLFDMTYVSNQKRHLWRGAARPLASVEISPEALPARQIVEELQSRSQPDSLPT